MRISNKVIEKLKENDESAFKIIYEEYYKLLYYIAYSKTKNKLDAEEIVQDTFIQVMNKIKDYQDIGKFKEWISTICRNLSLNKVLRDKTKNLSYDNELVDSFASEDLNHNFFDYIEVLDELEKDIIILKIVHNFKFKEISNYLDISINIIEKKYYKALETLKKELEGGNNYEYKKENKK